MTQNEINRAILAEIKKVANEVFANVKVSRDGLYTAAELHKGKNAMGENFYVFYDDNVVNKVYTIEVGTSIYRIGANMVFYALWQFEKLCHVKQGDKMRFTYGNQDGEHISAKAMYLNKEEKTATRKKNLIKLSERVAIEMDKKTKSYNMYYFVCGLWYLIALNFDEGRYKAIYERIEKDENYLFGLLQRWDFNNENRLSPIYKALFEALKSERANNTSEQRKPEKEPTNAAICESEKIDASAKEFNKHEALKATEARMREYHPNYIALIQYGSMYYIVGKSAKIVRQIKGIRDYICDNGDTIYFEVEKLDAVLPKIIQSGKGVLTCGHVADVSKDYPPEPYNGGGCSKVNRQGETLGVTYRPISDRTGESADNEGNLPKTQVASATGYNLLPFYFRQKVFPTEPFYARRKISRFKPRYFVGYTNYHLHKENVLEGKRSGNTNVYKVLIRGGT